MMPDRASSSTRTFSDHRSGREASSGSRQGVVDNAAILVSFMTVAELRFGASLAGWGQKRLVELEARSTPLKSCGRDLISLRTMSTCEPGQLVRATRWADERTRRTDGSPPPCSASSYRSSRATAFHLSPRPGCPSRDVMT